MHGLFRRNKSRNYLSATFVLGRGWKIQNYRPLSKTTVVTADNKLYQSSQKLLRLSVFDLVKYACEFVSKFDGIATIT